MFDSVQFITFATTKELRLCDLQALDLKLKDLKCAQVIKILCTNQSFGSLTRKRQKKNLSNTSFAFGLQGNKKIYKELQTIPTHIKHELIAGSPIQKKKSKISYLEISIRKIASCNFPITKTQEIRRPYYPCGKIQTIGRNPLIPILMETLNLKQPTTHGKREEK